MQYKNCSNSANKKVIIRSYLYQSENCTEEYTRVLEDPENMKNG